MRSSGGPIHCAGTDGLQSVIVYPMQWSYKVDGARKVASECISPPESAQGDCRLLLWRWQKNEQDL